MSNYRTCNYPIQNMGEASRQQNICPRPRKPEFPEKTSVAMAYIPFQENNDVYPSEKALHSGTIFPVLDKPFLAGCLK